MIVPNLKSSSGVPTNIVTPSFVFKPTKVDVYTPNIHSNESGNQIQSKNNISSTGIPMQATGFPLAAILVALISIPLAYRRK